MFCSSRRRHTVYWRDWISDVCSSDLEERLDEGDRPLVHAQLIRVRDAAREQQLVELRRVGLRERHVHRKEIARVVVLPARDLRSEERRVGKECRSWWSWDPYKKEQAN